MICLLGVTDLVTFQAIPKNVSFKIFANPVFGSSVACTSSAIIVNDKIRLRKLPLQFRTSQVATLTQVYFTRHESRSGLTKEDFRFSAVGMVLNLTQFQVIS